MCTQQPDSLDARLFPSVVFAVAPAVTMGELVGAQRGLALSIEGCLGSPLKGALQLLMNRYG